MATALEITRRSLLRLSKKERMFLVSALTPEDWDDLLMGRFTLQEIVTAADGTVRALYAAWVPLR